MNRGNAGENKTQPVRLAFFGAAPDTANMGVTALFISALTGIAKHFSSVEFVVFDNGLGERRDSLRTPAGAEIPIVRFGARVGRRFHRPENLTTMALAARFGRLGAKLNRAISLIDSCDAVLDVSGGDSFSDIYGRRRFQSIYLPKAIAKARSKPLILLPQTYGPYKARDVRAMAGGITRAADMAWARDEDSFVALRDLLGPAYDAQRHFSGVDMAFGLEPKCPDNAFDKMLASWLNQSRGDTPLVGFNVSGLLYNKPDGGARDFGLRADYRETVVEFLRKVLETSTARVVLIPHVMDPLGHYESDFEACTNIARSLLEFADRIVISPATLTAPEVKWLISQMTWFCGTRMHSTIAGLSTGVPTASISYSDKTRGVFKTCGQGSNVFDPRKMTAEMIVQHLLEAFQARDNTRQSLSHAMPLVKETLEKQFALIANKITACANARQKH